MLGKSNLLAFSFRALVLLLLVPLLWLTVARQYNEALVVLAQRLLPDGLALSALGTHIMIDYSEAARPFSVDGFTLHYGLILMTVLILASVGLDLLPRIGWLLAFAAGGFALHVVGVALLARGVAWSSADSSAGGSVSLVLRLFAIFWGLVPAVAGGAWALLYWLPRMSVQPSAETANAAQPP